MAILQASNPSPVSAATMRDPVPTVSQPSAPTKRQYAPDEARVRGQVRMHSLIAGYEVASHLASTLATTAAEIRGELHKLAQEVAEKIEAYSFMEDK